MRIAVCVKFVPDASAERTFSADDTVDRESIDGVLSELDEYAVEAALRIRDGGDGDDEVVIVTVGPDVARKAITKSLQMGADSGVHVSDSAIGGSDAVGTSLVLAAALNRVGPELVLCGMASTDAAMSVVPAMLAERMGLPQLTLASEVDLDGSAVRIRRDDDSATETIEAVLPVLLSVTDQANEPRYPSFKAIMAAKKKPVETLTLADLDIASDQVGHGAAWTRVESVTARPARTAGTVVTDDNGSGATGLVAFLVEHKFT